MLWKASFATLVLALYAAAGPTRKAASYGTRIPLQKRTSLTNSDGTFKADYAFWQTVVAAKYARKPSTGFQFRRTASSAGLTVSCHLIANTGKASSTLNETPVGKPSIRYAILCYIKRTSLSHQYIGGRDQATSQDTATTPSSTSHRRAERNTVVWKHLCRNARRKSQNQL